MNSSKIRRACRPTLNGVADQEHAGQSDEDLNGCDQDDSADDDEIDDDDDVEAQQLRALVGQNVCVDFEGRSACAADVDGMCRLLRAMLPSDATIDWRQLARLIVDQKQVGCVLKQCDEDDDPDAGIEDDAMDVDAEKDVYGVCSVVGLSRSCAEHDQEDSGGGGAENSSRLPPCVEQLRSWLLRQCDGNCGGGGDKKLSEAREVMKRALTLPQHNVGLVINQRVINMPVQIAGPLWTTLSEELAAAAAAASRRSSGSGFTHYALISRLHVPAAATANNGDGEMWVHDEERLLVPFCEAVVEVSCGGGRRGGDAARAVVSGQWTDDDVSLSVRRRVLLLSAQSLTPAVEHIKQQLQQ